MAPRGQGRRVARGGPRSQSATALPAPSELGPQAVAGDVGKPVAEVVEPLDAVIVVGAEAVIAAAGPGGQAVGQVAGEREPEAAGLGQEDGVAQGVVE